MGQQSPCPIVALWVCLVAKRGMRLRDQMRYIVTHHVFILDPISQALGFRCVQLRHALWPRRTTLFSVQAVLAFVFTQCYHREAICLHRKSQEKKLIPRYYRARQSIFEQSVSRQDDVGPILRSKASLTSRASLSDSLVYIYRTLPPADAPPRYVAALKSRRQHQSHATTEGASVRSEYFPSLPLLPPMPSLLFQSRAAGQLPARYRIDPGSRQGWRYPRGGGSFLRSCRMCAASSS